MFKVMLELTLENILFFDEKNGTHPAMKSSNISVTEKRFLFIAVLFIIKCFLIIEV